jgi:hypothetical protein
VSPLHGVARAAPSLPKPPPALGRAPEIHLHLHGVTPEDTVAILTGQDPP